MSVPSHGGCRGAGLGPFRPDADCRICWLAKNTTEYATAWGEPPPADPQPLNRVALVRPTRCEHLGKRTEFKAGCAGMGCRHDCELGLPAVPAAFCQACPSYQAERFEDADEFPDRPAGPGWLDK